MNLKKTISFALVVVCLSLASGCLSPEGGETTSALFPGGGAGNGESFAGRRGFNLFGWVITEVGAEHDTGQDVVIQRNMRIVVAGRAKFDDRTHFMIARYLPNGELDTSFDDPSKPGRPGIISTPIGVQSSAWAMALQDIDNEERIVVTGTSYDNIRSCFTTARYRPDGTLDTSFGNQGIAIHPTAIGQAYGIAIQPDGKIVLAGTRGLDFQIVRLTPSGALDASFGTGGVTTTSFNMFGLGVSQASAVTLQSDGKIVAVGHHTTNGKRRMTLCRYHIDGSLDETFGWSGKIAREVGENSEARKVAMQNTPQGERIVVGGHGVITRPNATTAQMVALRYLLDGTEDDAFGDSGVASPDVGTAHSTGYAMLVRADGSILLGGSRSVAPSTQHFAQTSLTPNGQIDASFGGGTGIVTTSVGGTRDTIYGLALKTDGGAIAVGEARSTIAGKNDLDLALATFHRDGSPAVEPP